jgi:hypothetical protein
MTAHFQRRTVAAVMIAVLSFAGCASVNMEALNVGVPVLMNGKDIPPPAVVTHFSIRQEEEFVFLHRLYGGGKPDVNEMIQRQLLKTPGDAVINVRIIGDTHLKDVAVPVLIGIAGLYIYPPLSLFLYEPLFFDLKSYRVEGDIVTYAKSAAPAVVPPSVPSVKIDPMTGLPVEEKKKPEFDPETGLPK